MPESTNEFPSTRSVRNFSYNGLAVTDKPGFSSYEVQFIEWTDDPGIGKFICTDNKVRYIPSCQLEETYYKSLPQKDWRNPNSEPILIGKPSKS